MRWEKEALLCESKAGSAVVLPAVGIDLLLHGYTWRRVLPCWAEAQARWGSAGVVRWEKWCYSFGGWGGDAPNLTKLLFSFKDLTRSNRRRKRGWFMPGPPLKKTVGPRQRKLGTCSTVLELHSDWKQGVLNTRNQGWYLPPSHPPLQQGIGWKICSQHRLLCPRALIQSICQIFLPLPYQGGAKAQGNPCHASQRSLGCTLHPILTWTLYFFWASQYRLVVLGRNASNPRLFWVLYSAARIALPYVSSSCWCACIKLRLRGFIFSLSVEVWKRRETTWATSPSILPQTQSHTFASS